MNQHNINYSKTVNTLKTKEDNIVRRAEWKHNPSYSSGHKLLRIIADAYEARALDKLLTQGATNILYLSPKPSTLY